MSVADGRWEVAVGGWWWQWEVDGGKWAMGDDSWGVTGGWREVTGVKFRPFLLYREIQHYR